MLQNAKNSFRFIILADPHVGIGHGEREYLLPVIKQIKKSGTEFDFVVVLGDIAHADESKDAVALYREFNGAIDSLGKPVYSIMGNHDERAVFARVVQDHMTPIDTETYYSFNCGRWCLVFLDSCVGRGTDRIGKEQIEWVKNILEKNKGKAVMIFLHHPLLNVAAAKLSERIIDIGRGHILGFEGTGNYAHALEILSLFAGYPGVKWVFNGHTHHNQLWEYKGIKFVSNPALTSYSAFGDFPGYRVVEVEGEKVRTTLIGSGRKAEVFSPYPYDFSALKHG